MLASNASYATAPVACRRPAVPACDPTVISTGTNPPAVGSLILVKLGDVIDVGLDWSDWLDVNGGKLETSAWAAHGSSPKAPTLSNTTLIDENSKHTLCILDTGEAEAGDVYWITNTVTVEGVAAAGGFTMPTRTLNRLIAVKVVA
ncbi:MAG: hypothetical protein AB7O57_09280 [Hyphomicrobiaceae bacterium]